MKSMTILRVSMLFYENIELCSSNNLEFLMTYFYSNFLIRTSFLSVMKVKSIIIFYDDIIQIKIDHTQIRENVLSEVWSIDVKIWKLEKNRKNQD